MGILLSDLFSEFEEKTLQVGKHTVNLKYRSIQISAIKLKNIARNWTKMQALEGKEDDPDALGEAIAALCNLVEESLVSWDLLLDENTMYPIVKDELLKLPLSFLMAVAQAMQGGESKGEAQPGEKMNATSGDTSSRQANSAPSQNGIRILEQGTGSMSRRGNSSRSQRGYKPTKANGLKRPS